MKVSRRTKTALVASALATLMILCLGWAYRRVRPSSDFDDDAPRESFAVRYARLMEQEEWLTPVDEEILELSRQEKWPLICQGSRDPSYDVHRAAEDQRPSAIERLSDVAFVELSEEEVTSLLPPGAEARPNGRAYLVRGLDDFFGDMHHKYDQDTKTLYLICDGHCFGLERIPVVLLVEGNRELEKVEVWVGRFMAEGESCSRVRTGVVAAVAERLSPEWAWYTPYTVGTVAVAELVIACIAGGIVTFGVSAKRRVRYWLTCTALFCACLVVLNVAVNNWLSAVWRL